MTQQYFLVKDVRRVGGVQQVRGQFIVDGEVEVPVGQAEARVSIKPFKMHEVKWIVGPGGLGADSAEAMGYETVAVDDFRYPPPRG
ncbi:MAG: hypothetical protein MUE83_04605 [Tabrizicola sp.]|jgi:hypothetical protein|nr:hypothetical protein [Tabrizicola sp.]